MADHNAEQLAEALDDLVMSKGVVLDNARLDWLVEWFKREYHRGWQNGFQEGMETAESDLADRCGPATPLEELVLPSALVELLAGWVNDATATEQAEALMRSGWLSTPPGAPQDGDGP